MEIEVDFTKSAQDNANEYYTKAKKLLAKKEGAQKAVTDLQKKLKALEKSSSEKESEKSPQIKIATKKEWYEKFHWFFTSNGMLVIAGRDAQQNEILNSKHFDDKDLFFHANIFGAPATILKGGTSSEPSAREEAAQFAASYSSAWKEGLSAVDVYAMRREQVSKSTSKGYLGKGAFLLSGEREWHRNVSLGIILYTADGRMYSTPSLTFERSGIKAKSCAITPGKDKKSDAAKKIMKILDYRDLDSIMQALPTGEFKVVHAQGQWQGQG